MKSSVVVSYGRKVTVSCENFITAMRTGLVALMRLSAACAPKPQGESPTTARQSIVSRVRRGNFMNASSCSE